MNQQSVLSIYLADDDEDDRMLFADALRQLSCSTSLDVSINGEQLLHKLTTTQQAPDIIFLDLNMPRKNGLECLQLLRSNPDTQHIPIVIISTSSNPENIGITKAKGADYYIIKPDDFFLLRDLVGMALQSFNKEKSAQESYLLNTTLGKTPNSLGNAFFIKY